MPNVSKEDEFERTYLAKFIPPELANVIPKHLIDVYIPQDAADPHLRLRQKDNQYEITKKVVVNADDVSHQTEETIPLTGQEFTALTHTATQKIVKDRYYVDLSGYPAQVDVFRGDLGGLVVIDFEFTSAAAKADFTAPDCCLVEVTQEYFIAGGRLPGKTYGDIEADLKRLKYVALTQ
ncbi:MAG TPA: hypothetical protein VMB52_04805 [Verrucomicrobiae bacterium]|nr:hypothetical protein [Verrucomicrobiae bacterium]